MKTRIFYVLIVIICLNSNDSDDVVSEEGSTIKSEIIKDNDNKNNIVSRSRHQLSITWGGLNGGTFVGAFVFIVEFRNGKGLGIFIPSLLKTNFSYTYWFNNYIGFTGRTIICGDTYVCFKDKKTCTSILQLGVGIRWSYNGKGINRNNGRCYSGRLMINGMWGSFMEDHSNSKFEPKFKRLGVNIGLTPFEITTGSGFFLGVNLGCLDIGTLADVGYVNFFRIGVSIGKSW